MGSDISKQAAVFAVSEYVYAKCGVDICARWSRVNTYLSWLALHELLLFCGHAAAQEKPEVSEDLVDLSALAMQRAREFVKITEDTTPLNYL